MIVKKYPNSHNELYLMFLSQRSRTILQTSVDEMEQEIHQEIKDLQDNKNSIKREIEKTQFLLVS